MKSKTRSDALEAKINNEQFSQLILWLTAHPYKKVQALMAAPAPEGFGLSTSITSIFRFYKAHEEEIVAKRIDQRAFSAGIIAARSTRERYSEHDLTQAARWRIKEGVFFKLNENGQSVLDLWKLSKLVDWSR